MIPVAPQAEPPQFDARCRRRGQAWLAGNPAFDRPKDYWTEFEPELREAFKGLCGYCAMRTMKCDVDHFVPVALLKESGRVDLAYEWTNLRYGDGLLNRKKWKHQVLDPFDVQDGWFEVRLPDLQMLATDRIPAEVRGVADFTLEKLGLRDGEVVVRYRREWFKMYQQGNLSVDGLRLVAPLIAEAVERDLRAGKDWRTNGEGRQ